MKRNLMHIPATRLELLSESYRNAAANRHACSLVHRNPQPQLSLRVAVTAANRERLRVLRATEAWAWEAGISLSAYEL